MSTELRERVARAIYEEPGAATPPWDGLSAERKAPWLRDADRVIPIVMTAKQNITDIHDTHPPTQP